MRWTILPLLSVLLFGTSACHRSAPAARKAATIVEPTPPPSAPVATEIKRQELLDALWQSPLGNLLYEYLTDKDQDVGTVSARTQELANRILKQGPRITNLSAVQLMVRDLYERGLMSEEAVRRSALLQGEIMAVQADTASYPGEGLFYAAVMGMISALPFGSPLVRNGAKNVIRYMGERLKLYKVYPDVPAVTGRQFFSSELIKDYDISQSIGSFLKYFGPVTMAYFFWFDWKESAKDRAIQTQVINVKSEEQWRNFLDDMRRL